VEEQHDDHGDRGSQTAEERCKIIEKVDVRLEHHHSNAMADSAHERRSIQSEDCHRMQAVRIRKQSDPDAKNDFECQS
jgi:hypothetical protein